MLIGWGKDEKGEMQKWLIKGLVKEISIEECATKHNSNQVIRQGITASQLCAIGQNDRGKIVDSCGGDSGGPLHEQTFKGRKSIFHIKGIVSFGSKSCKNKNIPGVRRLALYIV